VTVRFKCPDRDVTVVDENFGEITVPAAEMEDFVILKADGYPTFYLANVVDDHLMGVTVVCRGQEFLGQTWRQNLLRDALGFPQPRLIHLPLIMDMKGRKLSKRDGDVDVDSFRSAGYLPEALLNFIALLGWNPGSEREKFTLEELAEHFDTKRLGRSNAKFDREKLLAFNTEAVAAAAPDRLLAALEDYLSRTDSPIPRGDDGLLRRILAACRGIRTFADVRTKCDVLFGPDEAVVFDEKAVKDHLAKGEGAGYAALAEFRGELASMPWTAEAIEGALKAFCERKGVKMDKIAQPLRVAVAGRAVSPPIQDTLVFLGREKTLARIDRCQAARAL
jgi:glutamyl-tRNA synthetase